MLRELQQLEAQGTPLRVILVGAGKMGRGIALQIQCTPGMRVAAIVDCNVQSAVQAAKTAGCEAVRYTGGKPPSPAAGQVVISREVLPLIEANPLGADVLVEATNSVTAGVRTVECALENRVNVVLTNSEVDLLLGTWLHGLAEEKGALITSDAGDQPGVIVRMIEEIRLWGFDIRMAGNIKGFLNRYATAEDIDEWAREYNLSPSMCVSFTDGTKVNIEMALIANATGLRPWCRGMEGPTAGHVSEALEKFDFTRYGDGGVVDYVLGAQPGGGVFVVGYCDVPLQRSYMRYYKQGEGPYYVFYRPYHLCHIETPRAIAGMCLFGRKAMAPDFGRVAGVATFAKRDLKKGTRFRQAIGSDLFYGMIDTNEALERDGAAPVALLEAPEGNVITLGRDVARDEMIRFEDVEIPEGVLLERYGRQRRMITADAPT